MRKLLLMLIVIAAPWYMSAQNMTIASGAVVEIGVGASLTTGTITNTDNAGLVIKSNANGSGSLIYETRIPEPNATVERYIDVNAWHLVTPITYPGTAFAFYTGAPDQTWLASYNSSTADYTYITDIHETLQVGMGYSYWIKTTTGPQTINFTGNIRSTDATPTLGGGSLFTLLGNPFPSAIDWTKVPSNKITGVAYVWENSIDGYVFSGGTLSGDIIPMGQGFFVQSHSFGLQSYYTPAVARVHDHTHGFLKSTDAGGGNSTQFVRLDLNGGYYGNTVFVGFPENGTGEFDHREDATKLYSSTENVQFFAMENDVELCINANQPLLEGESKTVPLTLVQVTNGEYTMSFSDLDQLTNVSIRLEDVMTNYTQNIRENPVYTFSASSSDDQSRFLLHFAWSPNDIDEDIEEFASNVQIYSYGKNVYIRSTDDAINQVGNITVYDMMGRELAQQEIAGMELIKLPVNTTNSFVVVKVVKAASTKIQKVYIK